MPLTVDKNFVLRPALTNNQLAYKSPRPKEKRSLPFFLVPQTIWGQITKPGVFTFTFDYLIDEPEKIETYSRPALFSYGKNSGKVLKLTIACQTADDVYHGLTIGRTLLEEKKMAALKPVMRHYFDLIISLLGIMEKDLRADNFTLPPPQQN